ncbi:vWA domain-containing protein [Nocardioides sp.]|uniref:vWA domain-containing protein n=1 Tax=Nocardioides sp. TaxID=35761 RepID=UPI002B266F0D|nr:VWA domain-containing protein [Nocardioides sp.]
MELKWPWLLVTIAAATLVLLAWWSRRPRQTVGADALVMAHVSLLRGLPRYRQLRRRRTALLAWLVIGALVTIAGATLLSARPQQTRIEATAKSRDVMLCLDASGSMDRFNRRVVEQVQLLLDELVNARVGLTVFSGTAVTLVPLTQDLAYVKEELVNAEKAFLRGGFIYVAGVELERDRRASLVGDGVASCSQRFDRPDEDRSRSIIVTSDNDPLGAPVYSVGEGAAYAAERDVVVHAIASPATKDDGAAQEFRDAVEATGGIYATLDDDGSADELLAQIQRRDESRAEGPPRTIESESTYVGAAVTVVGVGVLGLGWLLQGIARRPRRTKR